MADEQAEQVTDAAIDIDAQQAVADVKANPATVEDIAAGIGWSPQEKWNGAPDKWQPADAYLRNTVDINRKLQREIKDTRAEMGRIAKTSAAIAERQIADARADLETRFAQAVDDGDARAARAVSADLARLEAAKPADAPDTAVAEFLDRNKSWYDVNDEATAYAASVSMRLNAQGKTQSEQVDAAEAAVRKRFPELFDAPAPRRIAPAVNEPNTRTSSSSNRSKGVGDLSPSARAAAEMFVRRGIVPDIATYAKSYFAENAA